MRRRTAWAGAGAVLLVTLAAGPAAASGPREASVDPQTPAQPTQPWVRRFRPTAHMIEGGVYGGGFFASPHHDFYDPRSAPAAPLWAANAQLGARLSYAPWAFLGVEGEFGAIPARTRTLTNDLAFLYVARGHLIAQLPRWSATPFVLAGVGGGGVRSNLAVLGDDDDFLAHYGAGLKLYVNSWLAARLDGRHVMGARATQQDDVTHHFELLLGLSFAWRPKPQTPADRDLDGIRDRRDDCPDEPGPAPSGCPITDSDGDGILDPDDKCVNEAGPAPEGCPVRDSDGDGVLDPQDACLNEPETKNGYQDADGCPDVLPEAVEEFSGVIEGIAFAFDSAEILPESKSVLDRAVAALQRYPEVRVEIVGHTDNVGGEDFNDDLSKRRAEAVRDYLVRGGVAASRLSTRGAGASEPRADNATEAGRAKNRRTEFKIVTD